MVNRKSYFLLAFVLILALLFAGCTAGNKSDVSKSGDQPQQQEVKNPEKKDKVEISAAELFTHRDARYAFAMAVDKEYIQEILLNNGSMAANYLVSKGLSVDVDGNDFRDKYPNGFIAYDVKKAKEYWQKVKKELKFDTVTVELLCYDIDDFRKVAEFLQSQFESNLEGVNVKLNVQPLKNKIELSKAKKFDIDSAGWGPDYADSMTFLDMWTSDNSYNNTGFSSEDYDNVIRSAKVGDLAAHPEKRLEELRRIEKEFLEEAYLVPLFQRGKVWLQSPKIKGLIINQLPPEIIARYMDMEVEEGQKKIFKVAIDSDLASLDHTKATDTYSFSTLGNSMEGLMTTGENGLIVNGLAQTYELSRNALTYTFHLRKDSLWSNGKPVTAHDFEYSWKRLADPSTASQYNFMIETAGLLNSSKVIKGELPISELGVKALDDYTLEVKLEAPVPYFLNLMSFPSFYPMNEEFAKEKGDLYGTSAENTLFNGAFVVKKWELGYGCELEKNDKFREADQVKLDGVVFRFVKDMDAAVNLYQAKEIDFTKIGGEFVNKYADRPDLHETLIGGMSYFTINATGVRE